MSGFIGRKRELAALAAAATSPGGGFVPIYGRRRVGKSELILHFMKSHPGVYFLGKQAQAAIQLREFLAQASRALDEPLLAQLAPSGWGEALAAVVKRWRGPGKLVLALDEFQWLVEASPELPSVLQELWDRSWRDGGQVLLLLCGSYVGFMEREVLGKRSPLFGRRTAQIHLQPFGYLDARRFHPGYSDIDAARTYFVCGGIPLYLRSMRPDRSVEVNLRENLLSEFAPLFREPDFLLREELREVQNYYAILMALAAGSLRSKDIAQRAGIGERSLAFYLKQLLELRYVRRRYPLSGARPTAQQVRYVLDDPLLRFWFRFVYPNTSAIASLGPERAFAEHVRPQLDAYFGGCFEALCREALPALYLSEGVSATFEVGEYWDREVQIDLVGLRSDGYSDLGECRFSAISSRRAVAQELRDKAARYPNRRGATLGLRVFGKTLPAARGELPDVRFHDLAQLYAL